MTDSMKFGPEWLRNMSADTTSSNNASGQVTNTTSVFGTANSCGGGDGTSINSTNSSNLSNLSSSCVQNNANSASTGASRNTFPEFRYGREEMLLLFDRNCGIPEILPSYKNLFVERVQFPLALVPSTDEEMMQGSTLTTQRPGWLQRSPVGFSTATRGTGRVGCMERGRMRGKSIYHPVFQRPNAIFDEEQRSSPIKTDRSWVERNGGATGDPAVSGTAAIGGGSLGTDAWNGNTPVSSPRREFSNHPRNMENWRRSRNEDVSGAEPNAPTTFSAEGGWRMNTSGFQNSHTRWGRSTSWRDDELTNNENLGMSVGGTGAAIAGGGNVIMLRSNSTLSTTQGERIVHSGVSGKPTGPTGVMRSVSATSAAIRNSSGNIWPNNAAGGQTSNIQSDGSTNDEVALPEWAMENPSDVGGTFDASGAFHGAIDDDENAVNATEKQQDNDFPEHTVSGEKMSSGTENQEKMPRTSEESSTKTTKYQKNSSKETDCQDSSSPSPTPSTTVMLNHENTESSEEVDISKQDKLVASADFVAPENVSQKNSENHSENEYHKDPTTNAGTNAQSYPTIQGCGVNNTPNCNIGDYAERMMKVTDDMIEKLIMDDEDAKDDHMKSSMMPAGNKINAHNIFMTIQQSQNANHPSTVSPALGSNAGPSVPPNVGLYTMGGMMVDHTHNMAALHQLQQQQMAAVAAASIGLQPTPPPPHPMTSSAPTDLWLYRDPQAKVQGPFSALEMTEWYRAGYFNENLFVRRVCDGRFRPLGELIKICNGQMPFSHSHLIPFDLNPTALTPPLTPVISAQPSAQANDFLIKTLNEHQKHQQHEKLKGNVTAAADSLSNALKSLINSVDISQVLNMHFQTLQDRFIHNQEIEIANELSKNECFRRLSPAEQDAVVGQKLQTLGLPEYLTSLTGLSNSLAALNPTAGTQLYDTIAECTKKEQLFSNHQCQQQPSTQSAQHQQQQKPSHHASATSTPYMSAEDFIMKTKNSSHDMNSNDLVSEFNLRTFLNNGSDSGATSAGSVVNPSAHGHEFLSDQQLFGASGNSTSNPSNNASQSPMMQMWMNSLATNPSNPLPSQQHSLLTNSPQATAINNQWLNGPLVGISNISLSTEQQGSHNPTPVSMWDVATLEQHVQVQQKQQQHEQHLQQQLQQQAFEHQRLLKDNEKHIQEQNDQHQELNNQINKQNDSRQELQNQQKVSNEVQKLHDGASKISSINDNENKQELQNQSQTQLQSLDNEKSHSHLNMSKRNSTNNIVSKSSNKVKNENLVEQISKKTEEERRRELIEERRRQKEERKRQQMEEEKRRLLQAEEEKRRQMKEEEKRQQQIQAQRRKALMNNTNSNISSTNNGSVTNGNNISPNSLTNAGNQKSKDQQRIQSSVAPWSTQTMASKSQVPGLAEIQKAERRERRADQQRQLEIQEKHLRALAAAAEAHDTVLKWNPAPIPVKSFAEIQAEEAKRLAHEQMELQRRKEQETHNNLVALSSSNNVIAGGLGSSSNIASIWSGSKIWASSANTSGFWEEPLKFNSKSLSAATAISNNGGINNNNNNLTAALIISQSSNPQHKNANLQQHQQQHTTTAQPTSNKSVKKSQSVSVMQHVASPPVVSTSGGSNNQKKPPNNTTSITKQAKPQKPESNNSFSAVGGSSNENKKTTVKNNNNLNKVDDYETEFTNWCTKSLNNMNTKVDVPTFVSFLRDLESPYEVKDYIRMYLGESKEYIDFAKQFLERRSKYKNLQRAQNAHDDDLCKPAQAITPSVNDNSDNKGKQKKIKKNKMTKLDARILGFSVTAAEGRINVGDRDYGDAP